MFIWLQDKVVFVIRFEMYTVQGHCMAPELQSSSSIIPVPLTILTTGFLFVADWKQVQVISIFHQHAL